MKLMITVAIAVVAALMFVWMVAKPTDFRHSVVGYSEVEKSDAWADVERKQSEIQRDLEQRNLNTQVHIISLRHGEATASRYQLCHNYPPTSPAHKAACERLDKQIARENAQDDKHPW